MSGVGSRTVKAVAERTGLPPRTVRFYAREGVVCPVERSDGDYRLYSDTEEEQLRLVKIARDAGLSLDQARRVLASPRPKVALHAALRTRSRDLSRLMDSVSERGGPR